MTLDLQFFIRMFFSFIDFTSFTLLSLSLFRIPILMYWKRLLAMQVVFILIMLFHENVLMNKDYYVLSIALSAIILSTFLLQIPLLYSILIWGSGYLLNAALQTVVILGLSASGLFDPVELWHNVTLQLFVMGIYSALFLLLVYFIQRKRLGFMFIENRFRLAKRKLRMKDLFIATFFVSTMSLLQFGFVYAASDYLNVYWFASMLAMIILSLIGLYITYKINIFEIEERFKSFRRFKK